jgi:hypothetical protein
VLKIEAFGVTASTYNFVIALPLASVNVAEAESELLIFHAVNVASKSPVAYVFVVVVNAPVFVIVPSYVV